MSRKGKMPIPIPKGVQVNVEKDEISVKGAKGTLRQELIPQIQLSVDDMQIQVDLKEGYTEQRNFHGLFRSIIANMVQGVSTGFEQRLEMIGVGYRAAVQGDKIDIQVGFSHPTQLKIPDGVQVKVDKNTLIIVSGMDKQAVGQFSAEIRSTKPPEPYQGKGIRYQGEYVRKKAGKAAAKK